MYNSLNMKTVTQINTLKKALNENKVQLGCWLTLCSATVAEICANAGFDWLTVDTEHAPSDHDTVLRQLQASSRFSTSPVVRVANNDMTQIKRVLDLGFLSLIANSSKVSTRPFMPFKASTQLLKDPWPGKTTLSLDLIFFRSEVTSIFTFSLATSLKEFITELIFPEL